MSRNTMNITKWVPLETEVHKVLFAECCKLLKLIDQLKGRLLKLLVRCRNRANTKKYHTASEIEDLLRDLEGLSLESTKMLDMYVSVYPRLKSNENSIVHFKMEKFKDLLWISRLRFAYVIQILINKITFFYIYYGETFLALTLKLCSTFNRSITLDAKHSSRKRQSVYNNSCPNLLFPLRKISITKLLQNLSQSRAEVCSHKLIDCLLEAYKFHESSDDDSSSNSSVEIYKALTRHMTPPLDTPSKRPETPPLKSHGNSNGFHSLEELVDNEDKHVQNMIKVIISFSPGMLGNDGVKKSKKTGEMKINSATKTKVLDYYKQILWGEVGSYLEHIILWWGASPLSARSPHSSQHLREWILQFTPPDNIPHFLMSALHCLADALGVYVTSTSWDKHFRLALVSSKTPCKPETGRSYCDLLQDLISLNNQFEVTSDWVVGAPLNELPLVEQIPVLHRLDHSIHTTRLWAADETKKLANNWNVDGFFMITQCEIVNCLNQLNNLRLADHTVEIEKGGLDMHVQVCASMRAKLTSEIKVNISKLKDQQKECIDCLARVCRTVSLANLQMVFPNREYWSKNDVGLPKEPSSFVATYLDRVLYPVLAATDDDIISNMVLRIMCEAWLDHIYMSKTKFSQYGALQLLTDFASVGTWIINCPAITQRMRKKMLKNEVLRKCEGVGQLLLRSPGERIKMNEKIKEYESNADQSPKSDSTKMPAEMYVPNQEQWLALRASRKKSLFGSPLCCSYYK